MKKVWLLLLFLAGTGVRVAAQNQNNEDVQFWPDLSIGFKLSPAVTLNLFATARAGQYFNAFVSNQLGTSINLRINKYLSVAPAYRHIWAHPTSTKYTQESRYSFDVIARLPLGKGFSFSDRNRGEVREIDDKISKRYRNRIQLERAVTWHEHQFSPYLAEEFHYDSRYHEWNRKQFWAGTRLLVNKHLTLDLHYSRNIDPRAQPSYWHVVGLLSRIEF